MVSLMPTGTHRAFSAGLPPAWPGAGAVPPSGQYLVLLLVELCEAAVTHFSLLSRSLLLE